MVGTEPGVADAGAGSRSQRGATGGGAIAGAADVVVMAAQAAEAAQAAHAGKLEPECGRTGSSDAEARELSDWQQLQGSRSQRVVGLAAVVLQPESRRTGSDSSRTGSSDAVARELSDWQQLQGSRSQRAAGLAALAQKP